MIPKNLPVASHRPGLGLLGAAGRCQVQHRCLKGDVKLIHEASFGEEAAQLHAITFLFLWGNLAPPVSFSTVSP